MHKLFLLSFLGFLSFSQLFGQKLKQDEVDKFTKKSIKATSWENLIGGGGMSSLFTNFRIRKIDENVYFELKMMLNGKIYSIYENDKIIFLLDNDSTITLYNIESSVACKGCGATGFVGSDGYGTHTRYLLSDIDIDSFKKNKIAGIRIYTSDSYVERNTNQVTPVLLKSLSLVGK
jgi:hypothetical protein